MIFNFMKCFISIAAIICNPLQSEAYITQTVYGFLDFTTTLGDTVMVFSPHSAPDISIKLKAEISETTIRTEPLGNDAQKYINPTKHSSYNIASQLHLTEQLKKASNSSIVTLQASVSSLLFDSFLSSTTSDPYLEIPHDNPEYAFLSRQPVEFAEEKYKVVAHNFSKFSEQASAVPNTKKPHAMRKKKTNDNGNHLEKSMQSSQNSFQTNSKYSIHHPSSARILKTATSSKAKILQSTRLPNGSTHITKGVRKNISTTSHSNFAAETQTEVPAIEKSKSKKSRSRHKSNRRNKNSIKRVSDSNTRKPHKSDIQPSSAETFVLTSPSLLKLNRTPGKWQYKASPKPKISIRKALTETQTADETPHSSIGSYNSLQNSLVLFESENLEQHDSQSGQIFNNLQSGSKQPFLPETLNVDISTPTDLKNIYYEIATVKTPFTYQAGFIKKTRFVTITSTIEKTIESKPTVIVKHKPLVENILPLGRGLIEGSITVLSPIHLKETAETPSLETVVETFSNTVTILKTQVLPYIRNESNETMFTTLTQTFDITTIVTATKTIGPFSDIDTDSFEISRNFKDFSVALEEAGSELNLDVEFGDSDNTEGQEEKKQQISFSGQSPKSDGKQEASANPLTAVYNMQQLPLIDVKEPKPQATLPYINPETVWETHIVPITNGLITAYRTLLKSKIIPEKTNYNVFSSTAYQPIGYSETISVNPFLIPHEFQTVTSPIVQQTTIQQTNSKVLKLTFGARTAYTTIYSTVDIPTSITMFVTTAVPIQPTAAFPGYFAPPFHPFQFVG